MPESRITALNDTPPRPDADYVLYWMTAFRRPHHNFALDRAVELARALNKPLFVLEALSASYQWASDRLHAFVMEGMQDNAVAFAKANVRYYPYVEPKPGAGRGLVEALATRAVAVVTDDFPCFFLPRMIQKTAPRLKVRFEMVDGNGLLPLRAADKTFLRAIDFRRFLQRSLLTHLRERPRASPFHGARLPPLERPPRRFLERWPSATPDVFGGSTLAGLPIDHRVGRISERGGHRAAEKELRRFAEHRLEMYAEARNQPDLHATSGLSPYLHFGHVSAHQVLEAVAEAEGFDVDRDEPGRERRGKRTGFWNVRPGAEAFLDQLITWRELGFNFCHSRPNEYDRYDSLPDFAKKTLAKHARDARPQQYTLERLAAADTYDPIWNAAQRELLDSGRIHNYLRMLWGKKVIEWSPSPEQALRTLIELNDRYAVDGRDPNSYSGIFWCFGRYDRAWGPERAIFGTVRYMSSGNTRRKLELTQYLERWGSGAKSTKGPW